MKNLDKFYRNSLETLCFSAKMKMMNFCDISINFKSSVKGIAVPSQPSFHSSVKIKGTSQRQKRPIRVL